MAYESTKQTHRIVIHLHKDVVSGEKIPGTRIREVVKGTTTIKGSRARARFLRDIVKEDRMVSIIGEDSNVIESFA